MQRLEVSCAVRRIYTSLDAKGLTGELRMYISAKLRYLALVAKCWEWRRRRY